MAPLLKSRASCRSVNGAAEMRSDASAMAIGTDMGAPWRRGGRIYWALRGVLQPCFAASPNGGSRLWTAESGLGLGRDGELFPVGGAVRDGAGCLSVPSLTAAGAARVQLAEAIVAVADAVARALAVALAVDARDAVVDRAAAERRPDEEECRCEPHGYAPVFPAGGPIVQWWRGRRKVRRAGSEVQLEVRRRFLALAEAAGLVEPLGAGVAGQDPRHLDALGVHPPRHRGDEPPAHAAAPPGGPDPDLVEEELARRLLPHREHEAEDEPHHLGAGPCDPVQDAWVGQVRPGRVGTERRARPAAVFHVEVGVLASQQREDGLIPRTKPANHDRRPGTWTFHGSERDVVFLRAGGLIQLVHLGRGRTEVVRAIRPGTASAGTLSTTAEEHDVAGDNLRRVVLAVLLVRPLAGLEPTLDVALAALGQVLAAELAELSPDHDAMPLGAFLLLARLVRPALARRDAEVGDGLPAGRETHLGIRTQV